MSADNVGSCIHLDIDDALDIARDQLTLGVLLNYSTCSAGLFGSVYVLRTGL